MTLVADTRRIDALVVGAGPAGLGAGLALMAVDELVVGIVERGRVGQTFRRWPQKMRFLTPSFTGNAFGAIDLNSIHPETSPAHTLKIDYPSGKGYAHYLDRVREHFNAPVLEECGVLAVDRNGAGEFVVQTSRGPITARTVIWAAGEFSAPEAPRIPGAELGVHTSKSAAWSAPHGQPVTVVGGYESGIDVACSLVHQGNPVTVVDPRAPWEAEGSDPSMVLAPRTRQRLERARASGLLHFASGAAATSIRRNGDAYVVHTTEGDEMRTETPPVLATGYRPALNAVEGLFVAREDGWPLLTEDDESTTTPGLFFCGPSVRHRALHLCFVYKFRQRFAHIAEVIGKRLEKDTEGLKTWHAAGMVVHDVAACDVDCAC
ncbi:MULTISPECIES: NAD(P)/FAD-dependent oxidoreductase [unclassified Saccharopolyspora]|uniref:NAD(P)/FAD-dependent oxidoreductase n=1 Tax=unclassified Saccharopolyspora TaxID=2646250 RepID=UPI001CD57F45|nr:MULTISPECIES: NAD(P)/FAD-dependent oxidoreductase [unclassified Saccharopolyspora]MCA1185962.1 NAD(P)-binding domain-containing protein [Saccharopolyspora sp. 6T]MCA1192862.1 NAD(P)-binding domain-containing protein [Saccharopolyspora sp. 6V]MCA1280746.1 NAD(P)-binding domain-containing protein [Saccharopolyspora sp. 7B]